MIYSPSNPYFHLIVYILIRKLFFYRPFATFGPKRMVRDLLAIPGKLTFEDAQLKRIDLLESHPYAKNMLVCLKKTAWGE
jgi:hypothetical protein